MVDSSIRISNPEEAQTKKKRTVEGRYYNGTGGRHGAI